MIIPKGITIHLGNKKYKNEIPDDIITEGLKKKFKKSSLDEQESVKKPNKKG